MHYTLPDDAPLAARMARLLALAHRTLVQKTGHAAPRRRCAVPRLALSRRQTPAASSGAATFTSTTWTRPRSSIEWIREIVHEYSHLALPAIGGYKDPEYWANGYLGERLIVRWFQRLPDGPAIVERAWGDFSGAANFDKLLIAPALALYKRIGPSPKWLARTDAEGMRYLIGQALTVDDKYGARTSSATLFAALPRAREATAADWGVALAEATKDAFRWRRP